jgi:hypothetical protein
LAFVSNQLLERYAFVQVFCGPRYAIKVAVHDLTYVPLWHAGIHELDDQQIAEQLDDGAIAVNFWLFGGHL